MDNKDLINLFFQVLTLIGTMAAGFFSFWKFASSKIDKHFADLRQDFEKHKLETSSKVNRVYERIDEKVKELVPDAIYQLELKHQKESIDARFTTLMDFLKIKFDQLDKTMDKLVKHDEEKKDNNNRNQ